MLTSPEMLLFTGAVDSPGLIAVPLWGYNCLSPLTPYVSSQLYNYWMPSKTKNNACKKNVELIVIKMYNTSNCVKGSIFINLFRKFLLTLVCFILESLRYYTVFTHIYIYIYIMWIILFTFRLLFFYNLFLFLLYNLFMRLHFFTYCVYLVFIFIHYFSIK